MKYINISCLLLVSLYCFVACEQDAPPGDIDAFVKFFGGAGDDRAYALDILADGGLAVVGSTEPLGRPKSVLLSLTDANGNLSRQITFPSLDSPAPLDRREREGKDVLITTEGNILVLGYVTVRPQDDPLFNALVGYLLLLEFDSQGNLVSQDSIPQPIKTDEAMYLYGQMDGSLLLLANTFELAEGQGLEDIDENTPSDMYLTKLNAAKTVEFGRPYGLIQRFDQVGSILEHQGDLFWCGTANRSEEASDLRVIRADAFGNLKWDFAYTENDTFSQTGAEIQLITEEDALIVVGTTNEQGNEDIFLVKIDPTGQILWEAPRVLNRSGNQRGNSIAPTSDGGFIITGTTDEGNSQDIYLLKVDGNGNEEWSRTFGWEADTETCQDQGQMVVQSSADQGFLIVATVCFNRNTVMGLIKTNEQGEILP